MANEINIPDSLDDYFASTLISSIDSALGNNIYGINHRQIPNAALTNKDRYGLTFFTRPQLNLTTPNIRAKRQFYGLLTNNALSTQAAIRNLLDPRIYWLSGPDFESPPKCPLINPELAFIPLLTNNLESISGWPDMQAPLFTSDKGLYGESMSIVDGPVIDYSTFTISASFKNIKGDPISYLFYIWLLYMQSVFEGILVPYPDFISENEIDYNTRIYRIVLDQSNRYVTKIAATGASIPVSISLGSYFDYNNKDVYNQQNKEINIQFNCNGVTYLDDILIKEFNDTVAIFNPDMDDGNRLHTMYKLDYSILQYFNFTGYPHINVDTYELEWWVASKDLAIQKLQTIVDKAGVPYDNN